MGHNQVANGLILFPLDDSDNMPRNGSHLDYDYPALELSLSSQVVLVSLYSLTALVSLLGNSLVILILCCGRRNYNNLSRYLVNLAIADLTMVVFCIPFTFTKGMLGHWVFGRAVCPLVQFMQVLSVAVSIFTNTAIGIDRYWAVVCPLKQRLTKTKAVWVILAVWIVSAAIASAMLVVGRSTSFFYNHDFLWECSEHWSSKTHARIYTLFLLMTTYAMPLAILTFTYQKICVILWKRRAPGNADESRDRSHVASKRKVTKMLIILVLAFAICWLPLHIFTLVVEMAPGLLNMRTKTQEAAFYALFYAAHWLAMASCLTNPIIYCFLNDDFLTSLKCYFRRCCYLCCCKQREASFAQTESRNVITLHQRGMSRNYSVRSTMIGPSPRLLHVPRASSHNDHTVTSNQHLGEGLVTKYTKAQDIDEKAL